VIINYNNCYYCRILMIISMMYGVIIMIIGDNIDEYVIMNDDKYYSMNVCIYDDKMINAMIIMIKYNNWYYYCILMIISMKYWVIIIKMGYNINRYVMMNCDNYYSMNLCMTDNNMVYVMRWIIIIYYWDDCILIIISMRWRVMMIVLYDNINGYVNMICAKYYCMNICICKDRWLNAMIVIINFDVCIIWIMGRYERRETISEKIRRWMMSQ